MASFRILVVEHDPDTRDLLQGVLESEGYAVQAVRDGAEALGAPAVDLVVLGVMTPVMNGLEYLMHRARPQEPVIALCASPVLLIQALDLGADALLATSPRTGAPPLEALLGMVSELLIQPGSVSSRASLTALPRSVPDTEEMPLQLADAGDLLLRRLAASLGVDAIRLRMQAQVPGAGELESVAQIVSRGAGTGLQLLERTPLQSSLASIVIAGGGPLWFYDLKVLPFSAASSEASSEGIRGLALVPAGGGSLELIWGRPRALDHLEARIALGFGRLVGEGRAGPTGELLRLIEIHALERSFRGRDTAA